MPRNALHTLLCVLLILLGLFQTYGAVTQSWLIRFSAIATAASPLPDVFGSYQGHEPMSHRHYMEFTFSNGEKMELGLDRRNAPKLYRNWGHIVRYGPYFAVVSWVSIMDHGAAKDILSHGLCNFGPLAQALDLEKKIARVHLWVTKPDGTPLKNGELEFLCAA